MKPKPSHRGALPAAVAAAAIGMGAVLAGTGWLYLLRQVPALAAGPRIAGSLPLQQLAGDDAQPLLRLLVAFLPAGVAAGVTLRRGGRERVAVRWAAMLAFAVLLLVAAGAMSDAVAASETFASRLPAQLWRAGIWTEAGLVAVGALTAVRR